MFGRLSNPISQRRQTSRRDLSIPEKLPLRKPDSRHTQKAGFSGLGTAGQRQLLLTFWVE